MSDFEFTCPECDQKISGDTSCSGTLIHCPACRKPLAVPAAPLERKKEEGTRMHDGGTGKAAAAAGAGPAEKSPPGPKPSLWELASAAPGAEAGTAAAGPPATGYSMLAMASLFCSAWVVLGFIPGILCGHLARAKLRSNPLLKGKETATAGLAISYAVLGLVLAVFGTLILVQLHDKPIYVVRESPADLKELQGRIVDEVKPGWRWPAAMRTSTVSRPGAPRAAGHFSPNTCGRPKVGEGSLMK